MGQVPPDVRVHVLPSGEDRMPLYSMRQRRATAVASRMQRGYQAASDYLARIPGPA